MDTRCAVFDPCFTGECAQEGNAGREIGAANDTEIHLPFGGAQAFDMSSPSGINLGCEGIAFNGLKVQVLWHRNTVDVESEGVSGLGDDCGYRALERIKAIVLGRHRVEAIKAQCREEIAFAQNHHIVRGQREIGQVLCKVTFTGKACSTSFMHRRADAAQSSTIKRQNYHPHDARGFWWNAQCRKRCAVPQRNEVLYPRQTKELGRR